MKTTDEIYKKIDEWDAKFKDAIPATLWTSDDQLYNQNGEQAVEEYILGVIDALLWVIGDNSGKMI